MLGFLTLEMVVKGGSTRDAFYPKSRALGEAHMFGWNALVSRESSRVQPQRNSFFERNVWRTESRPSRNLKTHLSILSLRLVGCASLENWLLSGNGHEKYPWIARLLTSRAMLAKQGQS